MTIETSNASELTLTYVLYFCGRMKVNHPPMNRMEINDFTATPPEVTEENAGEMFLGN